MVLPTPTTIQADQIPTNPLERMLVQITERTRKVARWIRPEGGAGPKEGLGSAGVDLVLRVFGGVHQKRALLVGDGAIGRQVAAALQREGLSDWRVTHASPGVVSELAALLDAEVQGWPVTAEQLQGVDIVILATDMREAVDAETVKQALSGRQYDPMVLLDLSASQCLDPAVMTLDDAFVFDVEDLHQVWPGLTEDRSVGKALIQ